MLHLTKLAVGVRDIDHLRDILKPLAERKLVAFLSPEGRRGTV